MKKTNTFAALRSFLLLWFSQSVSAMGTAMTDYALVIWAYEKTGTASSVTLLTLCSFLPTILLRFMAGAAADRWNKKHIMLAADGLAACGTLSIWALYASQGLTPVHLYVINFLLSCMNAFQVPAAYVATSLLVPKEYYTKTGGLQAASGALISVLSPVLGSVVMSFGGMEAVLMIDLGTFLLAFLTLLCIPVPRLEQKQEKQESFWKNCLWGLKYLKEKPRILRLILFIAAVNFLAKIGSDGQMAPFILSRTGNDRTVLGLVQSAVAAGLLAGGTAVTVLKAPRDGLKTVYRMCGLIFLCGLFLAVSRGAVGWCLWAFLTYVFAAVMNVHWNAHMRAVVPLELQGRVYSARDTIQNCTIPLGIWLGGVLSDGVFEPAMTGDTLLRRLFSPLFGTGQGSGIAVLFFLVAAAGLMLSLWGMREKKKE